MPGGPKVIRLLNDNADKLVTGDQGQRLLNDYRTMSREWIAETDQVMSRTTAGRRDKANALPFGRLRT